MSDRARRVLAIGFGIIFAIVLSACAPEVGGEAWCEKMKETPKGEWSANEAADFAKHCIL